MYLRYPEFKDKVVIVTGAGSIPGKKPSIGYATAQKFAKNGANVAIVDVNETYGTHSLELLYGQGFEPTFIQADMGDKLQIKEMVNRVNGELGPPFVLVTAAGIEKVGQNFVEMPEQDLDRILDVNLAGPLYCCRGVIPYMVQNGGGRIALVGSIQGNVTLGEPTSYQLSKAAMKALARNIAFEYGSMGIRANNIEPGAIATGGMGEGRGPFPEEMRSRIAMNRRGHPDEIANVILFHCSEEASYVNGTSILVDGGWLAGGTPMKVSDNIPNDPDPRVKTSSK
ncbi:SDR family oxidoreductase [Candidatus Woesearchaeota archaeon]|nr:SDR family oxidoreductase [Candidatus Woesearchaeota archaeon]